jgi:hypothetical protein
LALTAAQVHRKACMHMTMGTAGLD